METGNRTVTRNGAGSRITARRARQLMPDSKALGRIRKICPPKIIGTSYLTSTKSWTKYVKSTVLPGPANHTHRDCWVFKQSGRLNAEHKGLDTPSESDETQKQHSGKQKTFPLEVKTVNSLHVITRKHSAAPAIPGHHPQNGNRPYQNSP